ncbi:MAG: hypothetical protein ACOZBW_01515, partial [Thermodesulfobacteriota bacterium]
TIGPFSLTWFDVTQGRYVTSSTDAFGITVLPAEQGRENPVAAFSPDSGGNRPGVVKKEVEFIDRDIFPLKEGLNALHDRREISPWGFLALMGLPVLVYIIAESVVARRRRSEPAARIMARQARSALNRVRPGHDNTTELLYKAMIYAIFAKAGKKGESLTYKEARQILSRTGCPETLASAACELLEKIEQARFGGGPVNAGSQENLLKSVKEVVRRLIP